VAGKFAYDVIDRVPSIKLDDPSARRISDTRGHIEFKNVSFKYPTRKE